MTLTAQQLTQILDRLEQAYPLDMFPEPSATEREFVAKTLPGFMERLGAKMARNMIETIRERLKEVENE